MKRWHVLLFAMFVLLPGCMSGCSSGGGTGGTDDTGGGGGGTTTQISERDTMDDAFRLDIYEIEVEYDLYPEDRTIQGDAIVRFRMRDGQSVPLIHFDPAILWATPTLVQLDNETLDFEDSQDVQLVAFTGTTQRAYEFQRELSADVEHVLRMRFPLNFSGVIPSFYTNVNDIQGNGNEERFPTINAPEELALHRITFKVHGDISYRCFGSGSVHRTGQPDYQEWVLNTGREVASYTVMFMVMPEIDTVHEERAVDGVHVRVMAYAGGTPLERVFDDLELWLPELRQNLGPFPMPGGISIFLTETGGGMEYYGGTITSLRALDHEVFHMYFGCSTVALTYRDSWWDEAINMWYELSVGGGFAPISPDYSSSMVSGRTPISNGFDVRAYDEGAHIIEAVAVEMGGRGEMIDFLADLHERRSFDPFNTFELVDEIENYSGVDMEQRFINWLYAGNRTYYKSGKSAGPPSADGFWLHKVDMTPPEEIRRRYESR